MNNREKYLDDAWNKIDAFCKKEFAGAFPKTIHFRWFHDVYYWLEFSVTSDGVPFFVRGDHACSFGSSRAEYYHHPERKMGFPYTYYRDLEKIVRDWQIIKAKLIEEKKFYNLLANFEA